MPDDGEGGVRGYGGKLDIRPPFQREFVYKDRQRDAVVETIKKGFPLNVMYWAVRGNGTYEIIDGQQRTISVAQYVMGAYSLGGLYFHNLQPGQKAHIEDYMGAHQWDPTATALWIHYPSGDRADEGGVSEVPETDGWR